MANRNESSCQVPFTSASSLTEGFDVSAALGGGAPHAFLVDTGSVGILVPRQKLGPDYQNFDPSQDITFGYVSSGNTYQGQWVKVPVVLGVPASWDGTGDYPTAQIEVFAVDRPTTFTGGVFGIGFAIGGLADGGQARNPLLHMEYQGSLLSPAYIISTNGIEVGLTPSNRTGFSFIDLDREPSAADWSQPIGQIKLAEKSVPHHFSVDLPILVDTGIDNMILWTSANHPPLGLPSHQAFAAGITVNISAPVDHADKPALQYSFVTGHTNQPMAPSTVEWRTGHGINTGRNVLGGSDYLYDSQAGRIGFRSK